MMFPIMFPIARLIGAQHTHQLQAALALLKGATEEGTHFSAEWRSMNGKKAGPSINAARQQGATLHIQRVLRHNWMSKVGPLNLTQPILDEPRKENDE